MSQKVWICLNYENADFEKCYNEMAAKKVVNGWLRNGAETLNIEVFISKTQVKHEVTSEMKYKINFNATV